MASMSDSSRSAQIATDENRTAPRGNSFFEYIRSGWEPTSPTRVDRLPVACFAHARRQRLSAQFPGQRLVIHAGEMKQRSNDTFYMFRPHSAFTHLTGWGSDAEPGSVLLFEPVQDGHEVTLFFRESAGKDSDEFFSDPTIGEFWVGPRPSLIDVGERLGVATRSLNEWRAPADAITLENADLARAVSELRLVKDEFEIAELQAAVNSTKRGFEEVIAAFPHAVEHPRGERVIEGAFSMRARLDGNGVGYDTIAASGAHACILHWVNNDGPVKPGDLLLLDAGIELDSLYTADITRTIPVSGHFTAVQREVYEAVLEAADAAHAVVKPGITFHQVHEAAMEVIERRIKSWGFWPENPEEQVEYHRRFMVHGTSHHLGLDVHDCAQARREMYREGILEPGMVFTIEPGLYFHAGDLMVPEVFRGIGVRIEDNVVVTESGYESLSAHIPRTADDVEAWVASCTAKAEKTERR